MIVQHHAYTHTSTGVSSGSMLICTDVTTEFTPDGSRIVDFKRRATRLGKGVHKTSKWHVPASNERVLVYIRRPMKNLGDVWQLSTVS